MDKHVLVGFVGMSTDPLVVDRCVFVRIQWLNKKLSMTGVVGPQRDGNCYGSCGQINPLAKIRGMTPLLSKEAMFNLDHIWKEYHLNDMQAGCVHQRKLCWNEARIDETQPINAYGKFYEGQTSNSWNMWAWISCTEHPNGLLEKPCPVCGYKYGTQWLYKPVPQNAIEFLVSLPNDTDRLPACWRK